MDNNYVCSKEADIGGLKSDIKTIYKQMEKQLTITNAVYELTAEMRVTNSRLENIEHGQHQLKEDVDELKAKPGKRWDTLITAVITAIVGLIVGAVVGGGLG